MRSSASIFASRNDYLASLGPRQVPNTSTPFFLASSSDTIFDFAIFKGIEGWADSLTLWTRSKVSGPPRL